jgi:hypothetical protein
MVKNSSPTEIEDGIDLEARENRELTYFTSPPWKDADLDRARLGVSLLR